MTLLVNTLTWKDQADPQAPLAPFKVDFAIDATWQFSNLMGTYQQQQIYPNGVVIDNSQNNATIGVSSGPLNASIQPYQRIAIDLANRTQTIALTCASAIQVALEFYIKKPAPDALGINYAGANMVNQTFYAAYATFDPATGTIANSAGITSVTRTGANTFDIVMDTARANTRYQAFMAQDFLLGTTGPTYGGIALNVAKTTTTFRFVTAGAASNITVYVVEMP